MKTYGDRYQDYMPVQPKQDRKLSYVILLTVIGIVVYILLLNFTDRDTASIFKTIFKIIF